MLIFYRLNAYNIATIGSCSMYAGSHVSSIYLSIAKSSHSNNGTNHTLCSSGRDGLPGVPGRDGRDGLPGPAGPAGLPGFYGPRGSKGDTGEIGTKGQKGQSSAGVQGPVGPAGLPGLKGSRGDTGAVGAKGQKGQEGPPGPPASSGNGVTYTRWGKSTCRSGVSRVYAGKTGSSFHEHKGGAANYICMPNDPEYTLPYQSGVRGHSYVYGTEYEVPLVSGRSQHNAPCAVCYVPTMNTVIMIPAKTSCPSGWTREYYGYLMSEYILTTGVLRIHVWTWKWSLFLAARIILRVDTFITLKLTAMVCPALLIITIKNLTVSSVANNFSCSF